MSVTTKIVKQITRPMSDNRSRNITKWLDEECKKFQERRTKSGLKRRQEEVDWEEVAVQQKCTHVVSMKKG